MILVRGVTRVRYRVLRCESDCVGGSKYFHEAKFLEVMTVVLEVCALCVYGCMGGCACICSCVHVPQCDGGGVVCMHGRVCMYLWMRVCLHVMVPTPMTTTSHK